jgi:tryptophanase
MNFQIKQMIAEGKWQDAAIKDIVQETARYCANLAFLNPKLDSMQLGKILSKEFELPLDNYDHSKYYFDTTRNL